MRRNRLHAFTRQSLAFALAGTLAASACFVPSMAYAATSAEIQQQLESAQAELSEMEATLAQAEAELGKTNYELDQTRTKISELEVTIDENEVKLGVAKENLSAIIEQSYKQGGEPTLLELVLNSDNFDDLLSNIHYANKVSQAKREAIETVSELQDSLEEDKASLQKREKEQEKLLKSQKTQQAAAEKAAAEQSAYVDGLSDELVSAIEAERAAAAEASRKAAEEAARKEAEEQAAREKAEQEAQQQETTQQQETQQQEQETQQQETQQQEQETQQQETQQQETTQQTTKSQSSATSSSSSSSSYSPSSASSGFRQSAVNAALSQVGVSYGHGNIPNNQWDCSGLTSWAYGQAGVGLTPCSGTYSYGQFQITKSSGHWTTSASNLQVGDLVFYSYDGGSTCYHVAMYIGGGCVVHAIDYSHGVQVTSLYFCNGFCGGGCPV